MEMLLSFLKKDLVDHELSKGKTAGRELDLCHARDILEGPEGTPGTERFGVRHIYLDLNPP
jgi:hypothetical protein